MKKIKLYRLTCLMIEAVRLSIQVQLGKKIRWVELDPGIEGGQLQCEGGGWSKPFHMLGQFHWDGIGERCFEVWGELYTAGVAWRIGKFKLSIDGRSYEVQPQYTTRGSDLEQEFPHFFIVMKSDSETWKVGRDRDDAVDGFSNINEALSAGLSRYR